MVSTRVDASTEGVARWFGTWLWSAPSDARAGGPAAYALRRLAGWTGAAARGGVAIVGGVAGLIGVAPSASLAWVVPAVVFNVAWAAFFAYVAIVRGLVSWLMAADVVVAVGFGLAQARLAPHEVLPTGASWIAVVASMTLVVAHLAWRAVAAELAGLAITAAFLIGFHLAAVEDPIGQTIIFLVQIAVSAVLMRLVRGAADAADTALAEYEEARRRAAVEQARRAAEREQNRDLHDTVLATLSMVGTGSIADDSPTLRTEAAADLALIERLADRPEPDHRPVRLDERLTAVANAVASKLAVDTELAGCTVPSEVAEALAAASAQALANVLRHARVGHATLRSHGIDGQVVVEVSDEGVGFDPATVPSSDATLGEPTRCGNGRHRYRCSSSPGRRATSSGPAAAWAPGWCCSSSRATSSWVSRAVRPGAWRHAR